VVGDRHFTRGHALQERGLARSRATQDKRRGKGAR
jgi:hypothetical protein